MTLYRITHGPQDMGMSAAYLLTPEGLAYQGVLVPVEPCEHGNIDKHKADDEYGNWEWCPGAGVGEETP